MTAQKTAPEPDINGKGKKKFSQASKSSPGFPPSLYRYEFNDVDLGYEHIPRMYTLI